MPVKVTPDFFVVGGPVQPDRACYIRRAADEALLAAITAERFAYVLAPRASGKSSLMGRAIRRLRADGQRAAVIDLAQIGSRAESVDSTRWHYSIAYRICRELRLKVDLQAWWQERKLLLNEQKLVEFFWDIVLANTDVPVTVFFDEAERVIDLPFSGELFSALHSCYMRRVSEPEYTRLNFAVFGAAAPEQLCPDPSVSPFIGGRAIALEDFTPEECHGLAVGFDETVSDAAGLMQRIHAWTHGQPYLTQKLARGVARRGGHPADVDATLHELFFGGGIAREEPYLNHMRSLLTDGSVRARQALAILGRLAKGNEVIFDPASAAQSLLHLGGFVSSDENGMLRFRNRIVEQVFDPGWAKTSRPMPWQRPAALGGVAAVLVLMVAFWYARILPQPYVDTLNLVSADYALAEQAHERLRRLPGFGGRADRLLAAAMMRRSAEAETVEEARAADAVLRGLPNHEAEADRLMARYWLRRADAAARAGERDQALMHALSAIETGSMEALELAGNLIDGDYALLDRSIDLDVPLADFAVDWARGQAVVVDEFQRLHRLPLTDGATSRPVVSQLTALQHVGVTRGLFVDEPGNAGSFELRLSIDHPRTSDLLIRLRAPSGAAIEIPLPLRDGGLEQFVFTASAENGLLRLAEESLTGQWELTVFDRLSDETGRLVNWELRFPGAPQVWPDDPIEGIELPDPVRTGLVAIALAPDGRRAVAIPTGADGRGAATVWDPGTGDPITDLPLTDRPDLVRFVSEDHLLVVGPVRTGLWRLGQAEPVAEFVTAGRFVPAPVASRDGRYIAVADSTDDRTRVTLYDVDDRRVVSEFETEGIRDWALADGASFLAATDGSRRGWLIDPSTGEMQGAFFHDREIDRVHAVARRVLAVDRVGEVFSFDVEPSERTLAPSDSVFLGVAADAGSVDVSRDGRLASFIGVDGLVLVSSLADGHRRAVYGHGGVPVRSRLGPTGDRVVSAAGGALRFWRLPETPVPPPAFSAISTVALSADGGFAVIGHRNGQVRIMHDLDFSAGGADAPAIDYIGHRGVVTSLAVNTGGNLAASGGSDGLVRIWDTRTGSPSPYLMRHPSGPIGALAFSPDGRWLASAGPGSARVFDLESGALANEIEVEGSALSLAFAPDSRSVAIGDSAGNVHLAAPDATQGKFTIRGRSAITALAFADTPDLVASGSSDGDLVLWNTLEAGSMESTYRFNGPVRWVEFAADSSSLQLQSGSWLYSVDRDSLPGGVTASGLLPSRLRVDPAVARTAPGVFLVLADAGGGRLAVDEVRLTPAGAAEAEGAATSAGPPAPNSAGDLATRRDWRTVLGFEPEAVTTGRPAQSTP